jgi:hypothetical protein
MKNIGLALLLLSASGSTVFASSTVVITWGGLPPTSGSGTTPAQTVTADGEVPATVAGISAQSLVCDDFNQQTNVSSGTVYDYSVETISNGLSGAMFTSGWVTGLTGENGSNAMTQTLAYETAAVLMEQLAALGTENSGNAQAVADYNYAIWDLMEPGASDNNAGVIYDGANSHNSTVLDTNAAGYLQSAFNDVTRQGTTNMTVAQVTTAENALVIYTPTSSGLNPSNGTQEFLGLNSPIGTPEPSSWLLTAALGLFLGIPQMRSRLSALLSRN